VMLLALVVCLCGCGGRSPGATAVVPCECWGGLRHGLFNYPRAIAVDEAGCVFVVDKNARIQKFDGAGNLLASWETPEKEAGKPTGLAVGPNGHIYVADTHYYRVLEYDATGKLANTFGSYGDGPGEFCYVTDVLVDASGALYVSEYGLEDRIQKLSATGEFLLEWGKRGSRPGEFKRPSSLAWDSSGNILVADACNHRVQRFSPNGRYLGELGRLGSDPGELKYPYDVAVDREGNIYVCEYGNNRIQKFSREGSALAMWGTSGRGAGSVACPWGLALDGDGNVYVVDSGNNRIQKTRF